MTDPIHHYFGRNGVIAANALMEGGAIGYLFGPRAGTCATITSVALTYLSDRPLHESSHIPLNKEGLLGVIVPWYKDLGSKFTTHITMGIAFSVLGITLNRAAIRAFRHSFSTRTAVLSTCFRVCVMVPIVEELAFRGFLQDRLHDIQCIFQGAETAASEAQLKVRNYIQTFLFTYMHFEPGDALGNIVLIPIFQNANWRGIVKEELHHLTLAISDHALVNTVVSLRVAVFGT